MPNVAQVIGLIENLEHTSVSVVQARCVAVRHRKAECQKCVDACVVSCIAVANNEVSIDRKVCVGCGVCAAVCPTSAIVAEAPADNELLSAMMNQAQQFNGHVIIACKPMVTAAKDSLDSERVAGVPCLGRLDASLLIGAVAQGATRISLVKGECATCEYLRGFEVAEQAIKSVQTILNAYEIDADLALSAKFPRSARRSQTKKYDTNKRGFFQDMRGEVKTALSKTTDYAVKQALNIPEGHEPRYVRMSGAGTLPQSIPDRRERLLVDLAGFGTPHEEAIEDYLFGEVDIDFGECTSCRMCATFCPTGSLVKFDDEDGVFGLEQSLNICVACDCCVDICPADAMSIAHAVRLADIADNAVTRFEMIEPHNPFSKTSKAFSTDYLVNNSHKQKSSPWH